MQRELKGNVIQVLSALTSAYTGLQESREFITDSQVKTHIQRAILSRIWDKINVA